jgi:hypothetical protein
MTLRDAFDSGSQLHRNGLLDAANEVKRGQFIFVETSVTTAELNTFMHKAISLLRAYVWEVKSLSFRLPQI